VLYNLSLDRNYFYNFEYSLFLHSNDGSLDIRFILPPESGVESAMNDLSSE